MKRNRLHLQALIGLLLFLAACSSPAQPQPAPTPTQPPPTAVPPTQPPAAPPPAAASQPSAAITASVTLTEHVKRGDITMYYASYGKGEPLILLHGALSSADSWANQVAAFAQQYQVVTPDSRGQGRTTRGEGLESIDQISDDIVRLMDYLKIDKANIVGWDAGAVAGLEMARLHPERVKALVAYGGWTKPKDLQAFALSWLKGATLADLKADMDYDYAKIAPTPESLPVMLEEMRKLVLTQPNITAAQLASIKPRTLLLDGVGDEILVRQQGQAMADAMPQAKFVLMPGVGHYAPKQTPDAFNKIVLDFLKGE